MAQRLDKNDLRKEAIVNGILINSFDIAEAKDLKRIPGLRFFTQTPTAQGEHFRTYQEFGNTPLQSQNISRISITYEGEDLYFKKIVQSGATGEAIAAVTNKTVSTDKANKGFKGTAWIRTDKDGAPLITDGKADIRLSFGGYKSNPRDYASQQTQYALAIERGQLPATVERVPAFLESLQAELSHMGITDYQVHIAAHSMGSANAIAAAAISEAKNIDTSSVLLLEPVGASLAEMLLRKDKNGTKLGITAEDVDGAISRTTSLRAIHFKGRARCSNSAMLKICNSEDEQHGSHFQRMHDANMGLLGVGLFGIAGSGWGARNNYPEKTDVNNRMVGEEQYVHVDPGVRWKNLLPSGAAIFDPTHTLSHMVFALEKDAHIAPSIETLRSELFPQQKYAPSHALRHKPRGDEAMLQ